MGLVLKSGDKIAANKRTKMVILPDYCSGKSGIPSQNLGCSG